MIYDGHTYEEMNRLSTYYLTFADGYEQARIGSLDEVFAYLDKDVQKHGNCISCVESIRYDKYTGEETRRIW